MYTIGQGKSFPVQNLAFRLGDTWGRNEKLNAESLSAQVTSLFLNMKEPDGLTVCMVCLSEFKS